MVWESCKQSLSSLRKSGQSVVKICAPFGTVLCSWYQKTGLKVVLSALWRHSNQVELMLWGPIFILETLKIIAGNFIFCYGKVKHYLWRHIQIYMCGKWERQKKFINCNYSVPYLGSWHETEILEYLLSTGLEMKRDWAIVQLQTSSTYL